VVVCEGVGSVVAVRPVVLQAIGPHMTGLIETEPIAEIQEGLAYVSRSGFEHIAG
jgi:hypothetical protein